MDNKIYVIKTGEYSSVQNQGFCFSEKEAIKYCAAHNADWEEYYYEELDCLEESLDGHVQIGYRYSTSFIQRKNGSYSMYGDIMGGYPTHNWKTEIMESKSVYNSRQYTVKFTCGKQEQEEILSKKAEEIFFKYISLIELENQKHADALDQIKASIQEEFENIP